MQYDFEWDPRKAKQNIEKHGVSFEHAATVFADPHALSVFDVDHSGSEERWVTLGISSTGALIVVHHTYVEESRDTVLIRVISSRKATRHEYEQYGE